MLGPRCVHEAVNTRTLVVREQRLCLITQLFMTLLWSCACKLHVSLCRRVFRWGDRLNTHIHARNTHSHCRYRLLTGCRPDHHHHLPLCLFLVQYYRLEPPTANQQAASLFCHQPVLEEGIGLCDLSLEGRWNARSALPLGTSRLPYNGNQHSLGSGAITSSSVQENRGLHLFLFFFFLPAALWSTFMWRKRALLVGSVTPLCSSSTLSGTGWTFCCRFCTKELLFGISLLHVR